MYNDTPFGYDLFLHDEQIAIHTLLTQSKQFDSVNTQGNHVNSDKQDEEEEEDAVTSRWKLPEEVCQRQDLGIRALYQWPCEDWMLQCGVLCKAYGAPYSGWCLEVRFVMFSWLVST